MKQDDWIALGLIVVLAYALHMGSRDTVWHAPARRRAPRAALSRVSSPRRMPLPARLWGVLRRATAVAILLAACLIAVARALLGEALRRARRRWRP